KEHPMKNLPSAVSRRKFIQSSGIATLGFMGLYQFVNPLAAKSALSNTAGYGPLIKDPKGILNLPKGFTYQIISQRGDKMADGLLLPGLADGMGAFQGRNGRAIVVRNHENNPEALEQSGFGPDNELLSKLEARHFYDYGKGKLPALGGTSTFIYNENTGQ